MPKHRPELARGTSCARANALCVYRPMERELGIQDRVLAGTSAGWKSQLRTRHVMNMSVARSGLRGTFAVRSMMLSICATGYWAYSLDS